MFLVLTDKGITFSDKAGKLYPVFWNNLDDRLYYCNGIKNYGDIRDCAEKGNVDFNEVLKYYGFDLDATDRSGIFLQDEKTIIPKKDFEIINALNDRSFDLDNDCYLIKNNNPKNVFYQYSVFNKRTKSKILNSKYPIVRFYYNSGISYDKERGKYCFLTNDKLIPIQDFKDDDGHFPLLSMNLPLYSEITTFHIYKF